MNDRGYGARLFFNVLTLIMSVLLILSVIKFSFAGSSVSFAGFLDYVSKTPQISVEYQDVFIILGDWPSWANWLRVFIEALSSVLSIIWWICRNIANLLTVVSYYLFYLFV